MESKIKVNKVYGIITDQIIEHLKNGVIPWRKPWNYKTSAPQNFISKKPYKGINTFLLSCAGFNSHYWMTFNQAKQKKGMVKKGSKGSIVVFWKRTESKENKETGEIKDGYAFLRYYKVFNADQIDGIDFPEVKQVKNEFNPISICENVVNNMPQKPIIKNGENGRAFYRPSSDIVNMPKPELFRSSQEYYSTLFHELAHATGHQRRLNRKGLTELAAFGSKVYGQEELVAEMGSAFLTGHCGIENTVIENQSAYIQSWLKSLKNPNNVKMVISAASQGQKASDFILNKLEN